MSVARTWRPSMAWASAVQPLTRDNYRDVLAPLLRAGDFLLNLSVDVSSVALIAFCQAALVCCIWTPASSRGPAATPTRR